MENKNTNSEQVEVIIGNNQAEAQVEKLPAAKELLKESIALYRKHFKELFGISALMILPSIVLLFSGNETFRSVIGVISNVLGLIILAALIFFLKHRIDEGKEFSLKESFKEGFKIIVPLIIVAVIQWAIMIGALIPLIVPAVIISVLMIFVNYSLILEGQKDFDAVLRSRQLVKGQWLDIAWRIAVPVLIFLIPMIIIIIIVSAIPELFLGKALTGRVSDLIIGIFSSLLLPIFVIYSYKLFGHLVKARPIETFDPKEGRQLYIGLTIWGAIILILIPIIGFYI